MKECEFCKIIRGQSPAEIVYQNQRAVAILDINPIHFGHALVLPRTHCETFIEVPDEELPDLIQAAKIVSKAIVTAFSPEGYNIFSNNGKAAGQSVYHFHFHITPRYLDDNIQFILKLKKYPRNEISVYAERIRQFITTTTIHEIL